MAVNDPYSPGSGYISEEYKPSVSGRPGVRDYRDAVCRGTWPIAEQESQPHGGNSVDFSNTIRFCGYCGLYHESVCQRIKAVEYYPDGSLKRVEYV